MATESNGESSKGNMWVLDQTLDQPMDEEAGRLRNMYREKNFSALLLLRLAFQSLGVVFGDLGTSPLYVFYNTFPHGVNDPEDVIGALSLIIYSLTLIPLIKYVFIVLRANDAGQDQRCHQRVLTNSSHKQKGKLRADRLNKIKGSSSGRHMTSSNSQLNKSTPYHHRLRISEEVSLSQYKGLVEGRSFKENERS